MTYQHHINELESALLSEGEYISYHTRHGARFTSRIVAINHTDKITYTMKGHYVPFKRINELVIVQPGISDPDMVTT